MHNLLAPLIAANTVSADLQANDMSNHNGLEILANQLERLQFDCHILPVDEGRGKWNLIAHRAGTASNRHGLLFSGHIDTVAADESLWSHNPFTLRSHSDLFFGLGVTDMKGFFAVLVSILQNLEMQNKLPITIVATADEETTMAGARALAAEMFSQPALAILGEPTRMRPVLSHKGYLAYQLRLHSTGGHSSFPDANKNCINAVTSVNQALINKASQWKSQIRHPEFSVPFPTINLGALHAGDSVNKICSHLTLNFDVRPTPGLSSEQIFTELNQAIKQSLKGYKVHYELNDLYLPVTSFASSATDDRKDVIQQHCSCHFAHENYVTEAGFFERLGIPTIVLGPGSIEQAHQVNEFVSWEQLTLAHNIYAKLIHQWCY